MALIDRLLITLDSTFLTPGAPKKTLSTKQAAARYRVPAHSVRARISELRTLGYRVTVAPRRTQTGRTIAVYSLGQ